MIFSMLKKKPPTIREALRDFQDRHRLADRRLKIARLAAIARIQNRSNDPYVEMTALARIKCDLQLISTELDSSPAAEPFLWDEHYGQYRVPGDSEFEKRRLIEAKIKNGEKLSGFELSAEATAEATVIMHAQLLHEALYDEIDKRLVTLLKATKKRKRK